MKIFITALIFILVSIPAIAGGVGYINYDKIISEYQYAKNTITEIDNKAAEIEDYLTKKEEEYNNTESAVQKKKIEDTVKNEMVVKEKAFNIFREKKEEDIYNRIHAVSEKIRMEKGLDAVLDARSIFSGGIDITDDMIKKLNSTNIK